MLKRAFCLLAIIVISLVAAAPLLAQDTVVQITSPEMGQEVRGLVPIIGSASVSNFQFYKVEFGFGANPSDWSVIAYPSTDVIMDTSLVSICSGLKPFRTARFAIANVPAHGSTNLV